MTDGSADPSLMRAACTSATARTAHQGRLLPHHGDAAARSGTAHRQAPRTAPSFANAPPLRPSVSAPKTHPRVPPRHRRGPHARAQTEAPAGGGPPLPVRPLRLPAAPRTGSPSSQRADPPRPRGPRTARWRRVLLDCTSPSRGHGALRGERPGADDNARPVRRAPPPQARRGRQRPAPHAASAHLAATLLRWRPASLPPPRREGPPVPDRDTPLQNGRDGGPGHAGPHPGTWRCVCIVCYSLVYVPSELTRRKTRPKAPLADYCATRWRPPRHGMP